MHPTVTALPRCHPLAQIFHPAHPCTHHHLSSTHVSPLQGMAVPLKVETKERSERPPRLARASSSATLIPWRARLRAATSPAKPPPTTTTSTVVRLGLSSCGMTSGPCGSSAGRGGDRSQVTEAGAGQPACRLCRA